MCRSAAGLGGELQEKITQVRIYVAQRSLFAEKPSFLIERMTFEGRGMHGWITIHNIMGLDYSEW